MQLKNFISNPDRPNAKTGHSGFTLVEIVLALGIASFSLLAVIGTLPVGLETVQEARVQAAKANISRELRGELQQISFKTGGSSDSNSLPDALSALNGTSYYYSQEGMILSGSNDAYYEAKFSVGAGTVAASNEVFEFQKNNANKVTVTLSYPLAAPEANRKNTVFTLFVAKQKTN